MMPWQLGLMRIRLPTQILQLHFPLSTSFYSFQDQKRRIFDFSAKRSYRIPTDPDNAFDKLSERYSGNQKEDFLKLKVRAYDTKIT
jgi:hypothetical protein